MSLIVNVVGCLTCCGNSVPATIGIECRVRGDLASLCGYSEYTSPSTPPKKYRTKTLSGNIVADKYSDGGCTLYQCTETLSYSGSCVYDANYCNLTSNATETVTGCRSAANACCDIGTGDNLGTLFASNVNATAVVLSYSGNVCTTLATGNWKAVSTTAQEALTVEDTEAQAIVRVIADFPWGSWSSSPMNTCDSHYESRSSGFTFDYREGQWRVTVSGATPSANYTLSLEAWRSLYSLGSYTLYAYVNTAFSTDGSGGAVITGDVPITLGYDTYVANPIIF